VSGSMPSRTNRTVFQELAKTRLEDAHVLLRNGRSAAAYYIAGYVIECALKACIARLTHEGDFPPEKKVVEKCYSHDLEKLCELAQAPLKEKQRADAVFEGYWGVVKDWSEQKRYAHMDDVAAKDLLSAIEDPQHGVFRWLQERW
jgi:hypothetical protein